MAIIWLKGVFRLRPYAVLENTEELKRQKMFHTFKLSLARLNLVKNANRSDFKISKQILPVVGLIMSLRFVSNLEFAEELFRRSNFSEELAYYWLLTFKVTSFFSDENKQPSLEWRYMHL